jgi:hypothetical protein
LQRKPRGGFDLAVQLDERNLEALRQQRAEGGLPGAAQADEGDARPAEGSLAIGQMLRKQLVRFVQLLGLQAPQQRFGVLQRDRRIGLLANQSCGRNAERGRDLPQEQHREIPAPRFELGQVTLGDFRIARQELAGHAALRARLLHALADPP